MFAQQALKVIGERKAGQENNRAVRLRDKSIQISLKVLCKKKIAESAKIRKIDEIAEIQQYFAKSVKIAKLLKLQLKL